MIISFKRQRALIFLSSLLITNSLTATSNKPFQLNSSNNIERFEIDPNNEYVVFNEFVSGTTLNRFTRKIDGASDSILIGENVNETEQGSEFIIDPTNSRIISKINNQLITNREILSVSINGNASTLLAPPLFSDDISSISTSDNTTKITFTTDPSGSLFSVSNDGSKQPVDLSSTINSDGNVNVGRIQQTSDGNRVVFNTELDSVGQEALFVVPIDGSNTATQLTPLNPSSVNSFSISSDLTQVVYIEEVGLEGEPNFQQQLFSVALDGNNDPIPLTGLITGEFNNIDFKISPNSQQVVYTTTNETLNQTQLFSVPVDGSSNPILVDDSIEIYQFEITNNNEKIIYSLEEPLQPQFPNTPTLPVIFSSSLVPTTSEEPLLLSASNTNSFFFFLSIDIDINFVVSQNSDFVFYVQELILGSGNSLNRVSINNPSDFLMLNLPPTFNNTQSLSVSESVLGFELSNDGTFIIYNYAPVFEAQNIEDFPPNIDTLQRSLLSKVSIDGSNNQPLNTNGENVFEFDISNNDEFVVFTASLEDIFINLYSLNLEEVEPLCFPIKDKNDNFVTICL